MQALATVMANDAEANGNPSWFKRNPGVAVTIVVTFCSVLIVGFQYYFRTEVERGQREFYKENTAPKVEQVKRSVQAVRDDAKEEHKAINDRIDNVGALQIEQGNDHRTILKALAEKQRVPVADKTEDLKAAENKVMEK